MTLTEPVCVFVCLFVSVQSHLRLRQDGHPPARAAGAGAHGAAGGTHGAHQRLGPPPRRHTAAPAPREHGRPQGPQAGNQGGEKGEREEGGRKEGKETKRNEKKQKH